MQQFFAILVKYSAFFLFALLELLCFYLIVQYNDSQRDIFLNSSNLITGTLAKKYNSAVTLIRLPKVLDSLQMENGRLMAELRRNQYSLADTTTRVEDTLYLQQYSFIPARVVSNSITLHNNIITIDKGSTSGIEQNMGVIMNDGLVGVVDQVGKYYATVISLLNSKSNTSVALKSSGYFGNLVWNDSDPLHMSLEAIPKHVPVHRGDTLVTTGYSAIYPSGIMVGKVEQAALEPGNNFYDITVRLNNDLANVQYVMVVKNLLKEDRSKTEKEGNHDQ
ncbi:MAG: rod shape-determining protein MreC [Saprospiraceae bacterium]